MKMYTLTELQSLIDANGGKPPKVKRDLIVEQRVLETYTHKITPRNKINDGRHVTVTKMTYRYIYHRSDADNKKYTDFISYMELYIIALGNENLAAVAAEYWQHNPILSTMPHTSPEKTPTHAS